MVIVREACRNVELQFLQTGNRIFEQIRWDFIKKKKGLKITASEKFHGLPRIYETFDSLGRICDSEYLKQIHHSVENTPSYLYRN